MVGLLFTARVIPLTMFFSKKPAVPMIMSIYVTLGIFLLLAVRDPAANRSLIAFAGWENLAMQNPGVAARPLLGFLRRSVSLIDEESRFIREYSSDHQYSGNKEVSADTGLGLP
jgi:hypothetical protein